MSLANQVGSKIRRSKVVELALQGFETSEIASRLGIVEDDVKLDLKHADEMVGENSLKLVERWRSANLMRLDRLYQRVEPLAMGEHEMAHDIPVREYVKLAIELIKAQESILSNVAKNYTKVASEGSQTNNGVVINQTIYGAASDELFKAAREHMLEDEAFAEALQDSRFDLISSVVSPATSALPIDVQRIEKRARELGVDLDEPAEDDDTE